MSIKSILTEMDTWQKINVSLINLVLNLICMSWINDFFSGRLLLN